MRFALRRLRKENDGIQLTVSAYGFDPEAALCAGTALCFGLDLPCTVFMDAAQQPCRAVYLQRAGKLRRPKGSGGQDNVHTDAMRYFKRLVLHRIFHRLPFKGNRFFRRQNHSKYDIQHHDRDGKAKNEAAVALKPVLFPTQHTVPPISRSYLSAALKRAQKRHLVGVFQLAADRNAVSQPRHTDADRTQEP